METFLWLFAFTLIFGNLHDNFANRPTASPTFVCGVQRLTDRKPCMRALQQAFIFRIWV